MTYTTRTEAIAREITAALGDYADQHDIDAIADELIITEGEGTTLRYLLDETADFRAVVEANAIA